VRVAAVGLGVLGLAGGLLAAFLLAAVGLITVELRVSLGPAPHSGLGLGLMTLICSAAALRGVAHLLGGRPDRGGVQLLAAGGGFMVVAWLGLLEGSPLWHASGGGTLAPIAGGLLLLGAATAFAAGRAGAPGTAEPE
jgi:hypothetical protein